MKVSRTLTSVWQIYEPDQELQRNEQISSTERHPCGSALYLWDDGDSESGRSGGRVLTGDILTRQPLWASKLMINGIVYRSTRTALLPEQCEVVPPKPVRKRKTIGSWL